MMILLCHSNQDRDRDSLSSLCVSQAGLTLGSVIFPFHSAHPGSVRAHIPGILGHVLLQFLPQVGHGAGVVHQQHLLQQVARGPGQEM